MRLRLWANWDPKDARRIFGFHLEVERPYARVPIAGESIDLAETRFGLAHPVVEHVTWDEEMPNLVLGTWEEAEGAQLEQLTEAGFHVTDARATGCSYCVAKGLIDGGSHSSGSKA